MKAISKENFTTLQMKVIDSMKGDDFLDEAHGNTEDGQEISCWYDCMLDHIVSALSITQREAQGVFVSLRNKKVLSIGEEVLYVSTELRSYIYQ